jgi:hypothetical protein
MVIAQVCQPLAASRPEMRPRRRRVVQVERLRVVFAGELQHFLARHRVGAEAVLVADRHVLEILHAATPLPSRSP